MNDLIGQYKEGYSKIVEEIKGLSEEHLAFKPDEKSWSIREILVHITDAELVHIHRIKAVLAEENPTLTAFDQDTWAERLHYQLLEPQLYLRLFDALRKSFVPILESVSESEYTRFGTHNIAGKQTFLAILEHAVEHVDGHIEQIRRVKGKLNL